MTFYAPGLPSVAAATTDLLPSIGSIGNTLLIPWRGITAPSAPSSSSRTNVAATDATSAVPASPTTVRLPDFLATTTLPRSFASPFAHGLQPTDARSIFANMPQPSLMAANPFLHLIFAGRALGGASRPQARTLSTTASVNRLFWPAGQRPRFYGVTSTSSLAAYRTAIASSIRFASPRRTVTSGSISRNLLENREAAANRNPSSATAQTAFYQVLLKANMPMIVIERYNSGRFAANEATTEAYHRALGMLQAVGQAIAAQNRGATVAVGKSAQGTGAKDAPIHVVVDQPISDVLFRWVKFVLWFCLFTYFSLVVITMLIEGLNTFKRPTGRADNEVKAESQKTRFTDVHGCDEAKDELQELVDFLKNPAGFSTLGGKLPKGILLVGPPGTGKTLLARAVAGEAGVPFFYMSGSEFDEVYVGVGAKRVRDLFTAARGKSPAIVFIDELDAIGSRRNSRDAAYVKQTLNQLLTELDGFEQNSGVIILAATNFPELLDKALTGDQAGSTGRLAILQHHAHKIKSAKDVDLQSIALQTSGLSGAELESIVNQAAIHASKAKALSVTKTDFDWAKDKVIMGAERKSMVISPKEKELTAYHEAGHALVSYFSPSSPNKLYKVTVLPRGGSLGHTSMLPEMDKYSYSAKDFLAMIDVSLGGKLAEEIKYGNEMVTGGASSDLEHATSIAYRMVTQLGMSERVGPVQMWNRYDKLSSETKAVIESEVQKTLTDAYERSRRLLQSKRKELDLLAAALLRYETLDKDEVLKVISGQKLTGRIAVPEGPMLVPKPASLDDDVPSDLADEDTKAPPPAQPEAP
ncbi:intermembrane space aaa protease iap-1 [Grosmannia clavigera kw1407]|uniref:Intermembrane space aaa protease iap-1 n=1 Tax=Grosmannia clavigera (strain kw1407 / UAMH 11150) TaxID=655863 RepID=F0X6S4_GROCL|nr:intermembrane space aaa protease iap-1 [Grosmannia clavigera kw1407]EFX06634.1 intermembrane space aaa protease iap-1 [Grosmannia clavigera kw1407]